MKTIKKKIAALLMMGVTLCSAAAAPAMGIADLQLPTNAIEASAVQVKTGRFNGTSYTSKVRVYARYKGWQYGRGYIYYIPKIKVCTFDALGWKSSGKYDIAFCPGKSVNGFRNTRWYVCSNKESGHYFEQTQFGNQLPYYDVMIKRHYFGSSGWWDTRDFDNAGKCVYWSIDATRNCYF